MHSRPHTDIAAAPDSGTDGPPAPSVPRSAGRGADPGTAPGRLRRFAVRVCVLYTVLTVTSSVLALVQGQETDTHLHLLTRLVFVLIGLGAFESVDVLRSRRPATPHWRLALAGYLVAIAAIMVGLWLFSATGGELHPDAYRDAFLNFTAVGLVVIIVFAIRDGVRSRRRR